jgi:hypothetical protein
MLVYKSRLSPRMKSSDYVTHEVKCPFCLNFSVKAKPGKTTCPGCLAEFEVDDRLECIFADTQKMRLPVNGFICRSCGLVQGDDNRNCVYCGVELNTSMEI